MNFRGAAACQARASSSGVHLAGSADFRPLRFGRPDLNPASVRSSIARFVREGVASEPRMITGDDDVKLAPSCVGEQAKKLRRAMATGNHPPSAFRSRSLSQKRS
jgi:hypothetical protein